MKKIFAVIALFFAFVSTSAVAKNDYSCDKKFIFFPGGPEGGPFGTIVYNGAVAAADILVVTQIITGHNGIQKL